MNEDSMKALKVLKNRTITAMEVVDTSVGVSYDSMIRFATHDGEAVYILGDNIAIVHVDDN